MEMSPHRSTDLYARLRRNKNYNNLNSETQAHFAASLVAGYVSITDLSCVFQLNFKGISSASVV